VNAQLAIAMGFPAHGVREGRRMTPRLALPDGLCKSMREASA